MNQSATFKVQAEAGEGNRLHLGVESDLYAKVFLVYETDRGAVKAECFLLEPRMESYDSYLTALESGERAVRVQFFTVINLQTRKGRICLHDLRITQVNRDFGTIQIESDALAARFCENSGLALTYLTDKRYGIAEKNGTIALTKGAYDPVSNVNLFNSHDKNRVYAQNYYGSIRPPYQPSVLFGALWKYNPAQSGDMFGNTALLTDLHYDASSIHLKVRPMDRAKNGVSTDSVMETEYAVLGNLLRMRTRFIDYSMFDHRWHTQRAQEMPSLYINCLLDTFAYMSGKTLIKERNLHYWADMPYKVDQHFSVTGNWSAWLNDCDYGVGILSPGSSHHYAGRLHEDGEESVPSDKRNSVSYVAPIECFELENLTEVRSESYLCVGYLDEIRKTFSSLMRKPQYERWEEA